MLKALAFALATLLGSSQGALAAEADLGGLASMALMSGDRLDPTCAGQVDPAEKPICIITERETLVSRVATYGAQLEADGWEPVLRSGPLGFFQKPRSDGACAKIALAAFGWEQSSVEPAYIGIVAEQPGKCLKAPAGSRS